MNILKQFTKERTNLLPILYVVQNIEGYITPEFIEAIGNFLDISENDIYSVITSCPNLKLTPPPQHHIQVCHCLACRLAGSDMIVQILQKELGLVIGQIAKDLIICLDEAMLSACSSLSPIVIVDGVIYTRVAPLWASGLVSRIKVQ